MARYRKIDPRIWNDEKFRLLSDDAKLAFLFLLTHPHLTSVGAMRGTVPGLAAELGWPMKRLAIALEPLLKDGMVELNEAASFVGLPKFLRYNEPEGPNSVTKAWPEAFALLPECPEKVSVLQLCRAYLESRSASFRDAIGHGMSHGAVESCPIQEQEQEQEPELEPEQKLEAPPTPPGGNGALLDPEVVCGRWNEIAGVKLCKTLGPTIRQRITTRLREHPDATWWDDFLDRVKHSAFLTSRTNGARGTFSASLDWALAPRNLDKILAGNYDDPAQTNTTTRTSNGQAHVGLDRKDYSADTW